MLSCIWIEMSHVSNGFRQKQFQKQWKENVSFTEFWIIDDTVCVLYKQQLYCTDGSLDYPAKDKQTDLPPYIAAFSSIACHSQASAEFKGVI